MALYVAPHAHDFDDDDDVEWDCDEQSVMELLAYDPRPTNWTSSA
jgi:hypothetical protein